jgi:hypothetical protein
MEAARTSRERAKESDARLWLPALAPPFAWITAFMVSVVLAPWVCATGQRWVVFVVTGLALVAAAVGGFGSYRMWKEFGDERGSPARARRRFMAGGGVLLATVFVIAILSLAISAAIHRPCD